MCVCEKNGGGGGRAEGRGERAKEGRIIIHGARKLKRKKEEKKREEEIRERN